MKSFSEKVFIFLFFILLLVVSSYFVGIRDVSIGTDTISYINIFDGALHSERYRHEIGFYLFAKFFTFFSNSYYFYLGAINFFIGLIMYITFLSFLKTNNNAQLFIYSCFFFITIFLSNWYFTGVVNAIRHAMALSIVFFSLNFLFKKKYLYFLIGMVFASMFHKSVSLLIPFLSMTYWDRITLRKIASIFLLTLVGYASNINEKIISFLSNLTGIGLYEAISLYGVDGGDGNGLWVGFDYRFTAYNVFWFLLVIFLIRFKLLDRKDEVLVFLIKIYLILSIFYFIFGFGGFANRWAYPSWLFLPIFQAYILSIIKVNIYIKFILSLFVLIAILYFINRVVI